MQQNVNVTIDTDDDDDNGDDEDDVKREVTQTIEKFVQNRHVQTLKYLQHVIDENRHLRLHIEHLKRRQDDSQPSPGMVDPIEPEENPVSEIPMPTPTSDSPSTPQIFDIDRSDQATNTDVGDDFEGKYHDLLAELNNVKKQHQINREEFQRELERVDDRNHSLEKDLKSAQQQLTTVQKQNADKQIELKNLRRSFEELKTNNETSANDVRKFEEKNRLLIQSLMTSEQIRLELESQNEELKRKFEQNERRCLTLQTDLSKHQNFLDHSAEEISSLKEKLQIELEKSQELNNDNEELRETITDLRHDLQEKIVQEQHYQREKQMNSNFKEFIQVKRTLQACQQENEHLKVELKKFQIKFLNQN